MAKNISSIELQNAQFLAAMDQMIARAEKLEMVMKNVQATMGVNANESAIFQGAALGAAQARGAAAAMQNLQATAAAAGVNVNTQSVNHAIQQGANAAAGIINQQIQSGASAQAISQSVAQSGVGIPGASPFGSGAQLAAQAVQPVRGFGAMVRSWMGSPLTLAAGAGLLASEASNMFNANTITGTALQYLETSRALAASAGGRYYSPAQNSLRMSAAYDQDEANRIRQMSSGILGHIPIVGDAMRYLDEPRARERERQAAQAIAVADAMPNRIFGRRMGLTIGTGRNTQDTEVSMADELHGFGRDAMRSAQRLPRLDVLLNDFGQDRIMQGLRSVTGLGAQASQLGIRSSLMGGDLSGAATQAVRALGGRGDMAGVASLEALGVPTGQIETGIRGAAQVLDAQGRVQFATAGASIGRSRYDLGLLAGQRPSEANSADARKGLDELVASLKSAAETIGKVAGKDSLLYKEAMANAQGAQVQRAQFGIAVTQSRIAESGADFQFRMANIGVTAAQATLYSGSVDEIGRVAGAEINEIGGYQSAIRSQMRNLPGFLRRPYETQLKELETQKIATRARAAQEQLGIVSAIGGANLAEAGSQIGMSVLTGSDAQVGAAYAAGRSANYVYAATLGARMEDPATPFADRQRIRGEMAGLAASSANMTDSENRNIYGRTMARAASRESLAGFGLHRSVKIGSAGDVANDADAMMGALTRRERDLEGMLNRPGLSVDMREQIAGQLTGTRRERFDVAQSAIEAGIVKADLSGFGRESMMFDHERRRMAATPFSSGNRQALELRGIGMRNSRVQELMNRRAQLMVSGNLSPERALEIDSQIEEMKSQNVESMGMFAEGTVGRLAGMSAGRGALFGRLDSNQLAAMHNFRVGAIRTGFGAVNGQQLQDQDERMAAMMNYGGSSVGASMGGSRMEMILERILAAIERQGGSGTRLHPGEAMGQLKAIVGDERWKPLRGVN